MLDRNNGEWETRTRGGASYLLFPIHVSFSFLMPKGLNTALHLMLLRFLNRDYHTVFQLADAVATDSALSSEEASALEAACDSTSSQYVVSWCRRRGAVSAVP